MAPHARDRAKQAKAQRKQSQPQPLELYSPPAPDDESCIPIPLSKTEFIEQRISYKKGKMTSFFIGYFRVEADRNLEIYSVDTHHGVLHAHIHGHRKPNDKKEIRKLYSQQDVGESFEEAYNLVLKKYNLMRGKETT